MLSKVARFQGVFYLATGLWPILADAAVEIGLALVWVFAWQRK